MKFQGFIGPAYTLDSVNVDCQRAVNIYPEVIESGSGKESQVAYYRPTPGLEEVFSVGSGPIRLVHIDTYPVDPLNPPVRVFVVSGSGAYKCTCTAGVWTTSLVGTMETSEGPVSAVSLLIGLGRVVFVDGLKNYFWAKVDTGDAFAPELFSTFDDIDSLPGVIPGTYIPGVNGATHVVFIDGYVIYNKKDTGQYYVSDYLSYSVDPLSFASSEGDPDNIVAMINNNRELWIFNERSTEVFVNSGNADFPFERVGGGFMEKGCVAAWSVAKIDGIIMWLGRDQHGQGIVHAAQSMNPQRISTHAIESAIATYADISTATAYTYQSGGHSYYVLNFDEATWVYDVSTKLWHERAYLNTDGDLERHLGQYLGFEPSLGLHLVGDYESGKVYKYSDSVFTDDENPIKRMRTCPHISQGKKFIFYKSLELDMQVGVGLDGAVQGSDPQVMLEWSDDGGYTWSNENWTSAGGKIGAIGDYLKRVIWRRLGKSRDRVFRFSMTDPVKFILLGAELDVEAGNS